ncbi:MAG: hypothetical protein ACI8T1_004602 [Verrucomicrobiales bacterium]|jgi:hypothetical protein
MRRGNSPVITQGPYVGEKAEVDHIVPVAVAPTFCNWIRNVEFMPRTLIQSMQAHSGANLPPG